MGGQIYFCLFVCVCVHFLLFWGDFFFKKKKSGDFLMQMVPFSGQVELIDESSLKNGIALCYVSACETNVKMMQKNFKKKKKRKLPFYSFSFSPRGFFFQLLIDII